MKNKTLRISLKVLNIHKSVTRLPQITYEKVALYSFCKMIMQKRFVVVVTNFLLPFVSNNGDREIK